MAVSKPTLAPGRGVSFSVSARRTVPYVLAQRLARGLIRFWFRPEVHGAEHIPDRGPVIVAPVHRSFADFCFVAVLTDRKLFFMAKDSLWRSRMLGRLLVALGAFPVHREGVDREALRHAEDVLRAGQLLQVFPEGTRQEGPSVHDLHDGAMFLAARTGAVVVPVGIGGSDLAMPKGSKVPKRLPITLVVGAPLAPPTPAEGGRLSRRELRQATDELRQSIQVAYDKARGV